ncbi:MAG: diguanylate cyclase/phosphodiesterase with sensor(s), partial [Gemmatimonadetes bacterium]|nr:diguanylate cyclase/phosphodiesterase with sensor(s) [Gemmatimonadota bacterium]
PEAERFFGWTESELLGEPLSRLITTRLTWLLDPDAAASGGSSAAGTRGGATSYTARRQDGSECPVELVRRPLGPDSDAQVLVTLRDLTRGPHAQASRTRNNEQARTILAAIGDAVITTDATGMVTYLNPVAERLTGWALRDGRGQSLDVVLPLIAEATRQPVANTTVRCLAEGRSIDLQDGVLLLRRDGTEVPIGDSAAPFRDRTGGTVGVVLVIQDESEKRRIGHRLSYEAAHDPLTGLINRREFERRLARVVSDLTVARSEHVVLCLDLDRFKVVNDTCGHEAGDTLLRDLCALLSRHMRKRDTLARLGGDEFAVLLENCPLVEAERIAESLRAVVEQFRFERDGHAFWLGVSIGLIPVTADSGGVPAVLQAADAACYEAKSRGGNRVQR